MNYIIITGASKGLGYSITKQLLSKDNHIICISRTCNRKLVDMAKANNYSVDYYEYDLSDTSGLNDLVENIFKKINIGENDSINLINNAGVLAPIKPIDKCDSSEIVKNITVNTISPMILTSLFAKYTKNYSIEKRVINISSGAGKKPYYGWAAYCSSKAAIDLFSRCVSLEQHSQAFPLKIISFAPGIIDTDMQQEIRSSDVENFDQVERFIGFKNDGKLMKPDFVASKVINLLFDKEFNDGGVVDISEYI